MTHCGSCTDAQCWGCQSCAKKANTIDQLRAQLARVTEDRDHWCALTGQAKQDVMNERKEVRMLRAHLAIVRNLLDFHARCEADTDCDLGKHLRQALADLPDA